MDYWHKYIDWIALVGVVSAVQWPSNNFQASANAAISKALVCMQKPLLIQSTHDRWRLNLLLRIFKTPSLYEWIWRFHVEDSGMMEIDVISTIRMHWWCMLTYFVFIRNGWLCSKIEAPTIKYVQPTIISTVYS